MLADYIRVEIEVHTVDANHDDYTTGMIEGNRTTGLLGYVADNFVDVLAYPLQKTVARQQIFDFTEPLYEVQTNIIHRRHGNKMNFLWSFFTIYDSVAWSIMGAILLLQILFFISKQYYHDNFKQASNFDEITDGIWEAMKLTLGRGLEIPARRNYAVKFNVIVIHFLHYVILLGVYSSWLLSQHAVKRTPRLSGFPELISNLETRKRFFVSTSGKDWFFETVRDSHVYPYKDIRKSLQNNPAVITKSKQETINSVFKIPGALAIVMEDDEANGIAKTFCNLVTMKEPVSISTAHLAFNKGSRFVKPINEAINVNRVLILKIFRKYVNYLERLTPEKCEEKNRMKVNNHVVLPYYGLCLVWTMMSGISAICFFAECAWSFVSNRWKCHKIR